ncbi:MAG: hypothetical protein KKE30_22605 [Gammaproteobacteria bacterium]|nr:hypothetical protein [Gammaproteobacteria bacterium]
MSTDLGISNSLLRLTGKSVWLSDIDVSDWFIFHRKNNILGFRLVPSVVLSQIGEFLQQMSVFSEVGCIGLIDIDDVFTPKQLCYLNELGVTLYRSKLRQSEYLSRLQIVFLQESNFYVEDSYPEHTIRIGLSHGIDIPLKKTLLQYGGLLEFDYILCAKPYESLADNAFLNLTVPELRSHQKPFCCALPFGVPKFDRFLRSCQPATQPTALVYHLSNLKIEHPTVKLYIEDTLRFLLESYSERVIYFRPFPDDLLDNQIQLIHENLKAYPNYRLSSNACYIEDYSKAKVMICHREYSEHLFNQASGRPIVVFHPSRYKTTGLIDSIDFSDFKAELDHYINLSDDLTCNSSVFNQGRSVNYLIDNLDYILDDRKHPDWQYFQLSDLHSVNRTQLIEYYLAGALPFHKVSLRNLELAPQEPTAWLAALTSLGRAPIYMNVQLSQMYWLEIVVILRRIAHTNIPAELNNRLKHWFQLLPQICRAFICEQVDMSEAVSPERDLIAKFMTLDIQTAEIKPVLPLFIKNRDLNEQLSHGKIQLYGAGQLTRQLLTDPRFTARFDTVRLVDSDPRVQGSTVAGYVVESPDLLQKSLAPVVICSRAFSEEIEYLLRYQMALDREFYVLH